MRISEWSSDGCSSDLLLDARGGQRVAIAGSPVDVGLGTHRQKAEQPDDDEDQQSVEELLRKNLIFFFHERSGPDVLVALDIEAQHGQPQEQRREQQVVRNVCGREHAAAQTLEMTNQRQIRKYFVERYAVVVREDVGEPDHQQQAKNTSEGQR